MRLAVISEKCNKVFCNYTFVSLFIYSLVYCVLSFISLSFLIFSLVFAAAFCCLQLPLAAFYSFLLPSSAISNSQAQFEIHLYGHISDNRLKCMAVGVGNRRGLEGDTFFLMFYAPDSQSCSSFSAKNTQSVNQVHGTT